MKIKVYRAFVDQPNRKHRLYEFHGRNCIAMDSGEQDFIKLFFTEGHALSVEATRDCVKEMNMQCCHYELKEGLSMKLRTLKNGLYPFNGEEYDC